MKLEEVAQVIIGSLIHREQVIDGVYSYPVFQFKIFEEKGNDFEVIQTNRPLEKQLTQKGDILFRLVSPNKMILIQDDPYENLLVSSQICIIRPDPTLMNPVFLKWYLESESGQKQISLQLSGSTIQKITVQALRNLIVPQVRLEMQNKVCDLILLWEREKMIFEQMILEKEKLYQNIIQDCIVEKEK